MAREKDKTTRKNHPEGKVAAMVAGLKDLRRPKGWKVEAVPKEEHQELLDRAEGIVDHKFLDRGLLEAALTHPSAAKHTKTSHNYERLEFLGDSILGSVIATELFERFPKLEEGGLTRIKVSLVSGAMLSRISEEQGLGELIIFGDSEVGTSGRGMNSALENVYEAIVAALFLDGGIEPAAAWILKTLGPYISEDIASTPESPKSALQEFLQAQHRKPVYEIVNVEGPPHDRVFSAEVSVDGEVMGAGEGHSKKVAEMRAAKEALDKLK